MKQKTLESLSGSDSGESAEMAPIHAKVQCNFRYRRLETLDSGGYRLWLGCVPGTVKLTQEKIPDERSLASDVVKLPYKRGTMRITCSPAPEKVIVIGARGERVLDGGSASLTIELHEGDEYVELKKQKFLPRRIPIPVWEHGDVVVESVLLDPEI